MSRQAQDTCGPLEIDNALTVVRGLEKDMQEAKTSAAQGKLKPLPGETVSFMQIFCTLFVHTNRATSYERVLTCVFCV